MARTSSSASSYPFVSQDAKELFLSRYDQNAARYWPSSSLKDADTIMVDTLYGKTFIRVAGRLDGPPLVLIPGDCETSLAWSFVVVKYSKEHRIYALDHIDDIGRSIPNKTEQMRKPDDYVVWLDEVFRSLNLDQLNLVAHSYGAWQASLYAIAHPERLKKMVLMSPSATVLPPRIGLLVRAIIFEMVHSRWITERYLHWFAPACSKRESMKEILDGMVEEQILARKCYPRRTFIRPTVLTAKEWHKLSVNVPTLFLVGDEEVVYDPQDAIIHLEKVAPRIKSVTVPNADHHMALIEPDFVCETVLEFLSQPEVE